MNFIRRFEDRLRPSSVLWLLPAFSVLPVFTAAALYEEENLPNAFQSVSTSAILWLSCLAVVAAIWGRFRPIYATYATVLFALYDSLRVREVVYDTLRDTLNLGGNPNWVTLIALVLAVVLLGMATVVHATLFRVVVLVAACAQIVTLILFHVLTVTGPIGLASEAEAQFISQYLEKHGAIADLCGIQDRSCFSGRPHDLAATLGNSHLNPDSMVRLLEDMDGSGPALFTWTESAFAATADEAMRHITVHIDEANQALVLINQESPTRAFGHMKIAFSVLAGAFQQAWVTISLLILWRHGDYAWSKRRWRRI